MLTIHLFKGLPASGKTTEAQRLIDETPGMYKRVNKDDIRAMLDNGKWSKDNEKMVLRVRDMIIVDALNSGKHVIIDDTNLHHKHLIAMERIVEASPHEVQIKEKFFDEDVPTCISRDLKRPNSVGSKVIIDMYNQFLRLKPEKLEQDITLPSAIIVDLDGTVATNDGHRGWYEYDKVDGDIPKQNIIDIVRALDAREHQIIFLSGRDSVCREMTIDWIEKHIGVKGYGLFMRIEGDHRKDTIIKRELFDEHVKGKYYITAVLDDRDQVVEMWRSLGLDCLQVAYGNF